MRDTKPALEMEITIAVWSEWLETLDAGSSQRSSSQPINHLIYSVLFHNKEFTGEESKSNNDAFV